VLLSAAPFALVALATPTSLATTLATLAAALRGLSTFASCLARLFGGELVRGALLVRRAATLGCNFALLLLIHGGEATTTLILLVTPFSHVSTLLL
jgi:hypothetical protein